MCGIVGYTGKQSVAKQILDALELLEYRGYDSAGMAIVDETNGQVQIRKRAGRVADLEKVWKANPVNGICGIGHTRWATHGGVSDVNAHPHRAGRVTLVHNGIIENYEELKDHFGLADELISDTDSEVVAAVLNRFYTGDPHEALFQTVKCLKGTFALVVIFDDIPNVIFAIRNVSPIVAAYREDGTMLASDVAALGGQATSYMVVPEYHVVELHTDDIRVYNMKNELCEAEFLDIDWDTTRAGKGNYPFYMEKEIMEQPEAIAKTIAPRISNGRIELGFKHITAEMLKKVNSIKIIGCGSAYHVGFVAGYFMRAALRIPVESVLASEFRYDDPIVDENTLAIVISQSGETLDTLYGLREAKKHGAKTIAIVNVVGSTIANESEDVLYTWAGPEIAVATTKAYSTQLVLIHLLMLCIAQAQGKMSEQQIAHEIECLERIPEQLKFMLSNVEQVQFLASQFFNGRDMFFIGRNVDYALSLEASLKLKEISYIHSEAYAAGELKHGTISLIENGTLVIALCTYRPLLEKMISNIKEVKARGASVIAVINEDDAQTETVADYVIRIPECESIATPSLTIVPLQLFAYYIASLKGCDIDKPRNLPKSVTVE